MTDERIKNGHGPMDKQNVLVYCELEGCRQYLHNSDEFLSHLKKVHNTNLVEYREEYPAARVGSPMEPQQDDPVRALAEYQLIEEKRIEDLKRVRILNPEIVEKEAQAFEDWEKKYYGKLKDEFKEQPERSESFDPNKINFNPADYDNLEDVLKDKFPKQYEYFCKARQSYLDQGLPRSGLLDILCFHEMLTRDLGFSMLLTNQSGIIQPNKEQLSRVEQITEANKKMMMALKEIFTRAKEEFTVQKLHQQVLDKAFAFVKENIGEFAFQCEACGNVLNSQGLPHWALKFDKDGRMEYYVWNDEIWYMVKQKWIPVYLMAFILRTSILGIIYTGQKRGLLYTEDTEYREQHHKHKVALDSVEFIIEDEELKCKNLRDIYEHLYHKKSLEWSVINEN